jgi:hypothetical protein
MADIDKLLDDQKARDDEESGASKWEPKEDDVLSGYLIKTGWYDGGDYDPSMWLLVKDEEGDTHRVYCPTVLHNKVTEEMPAIGSGIAIRYEGRVQGASRKYHSYTFGLVPDSGGKVKQDPKYWREHGVYRGSAGQDSYSSSQAGAVDAEDTDFF